MEFPWAILLLYGVLGDEPRCNFSMVFSDDMVLQRNNAVVFGSWDGISDWLQISVIDEVSNTTRAEVYGDLDGSSWRAHLPLSLGSGGSYSITLSIPDGIVARINRVTFGDVFVCTGQSNMALGSHYTFNSGIKSQVRFLDLAGMDYLKIQQQVPRYLAQVPPASGKWLSGKEAAAYAPFFSGVCLYFGHRMMDSGVPIGLVHGAIGGSMIEQWVPNSTTAKCQHTMLNVKGRVPAESLYNGIIAPLLNMSISGIVFYQGENNVAGDPKAYGCQLEELIKMWRRQWSYFSGTTAAQVPFGVVTLAPGGSEGHDWRMAHFRFAQTRSSHVLPNVFITHAHDLGEPWPYQAACVKTGCCYNHSSKASHFTPDPLLCSAPRLDPVDGDWFNTTTEIYMGPIHCRNKRRLGYRLGDSMNRLVSGKSVVGPFVNQADWSIEGTVVLSVDGLDDDHLVVGGPIGFQVCSSDQLLCSCPFWEHRKVNASLTEWYCYVDHSLVVSGTNPDSTLWKAVPLVVHMNVTSMSITQPGILAVRYAWSDSPCVNLNDAGIKNGTRPALIAYCGISTEISAQPLSPFFFARPSMAANYTQSILAII